MSVVEAIYTKASLTLGITTFNNSSSAERDYESQILLCEIICAFRHKHKSLPQITPEPSLHARCVHARHCVCTLVSVQFVEPCPFISFFTLFKPISEASIFLTA